MHPPSEQEETLPQNAEPATRDRNAREHKHRGLLIAVIELAKRLSGTEIVLVLALLMLGYVAQSAAHWVVQLGALIAIPAIIAIAINK